MPSPLPELRNGLARNEITGRLTEMANLPIKQLDGRLRSGEIFVAEVDGEARQFWPKWIDEDQKPPAEDVGHLARVPNSLNAYRS